MIVQQVAHYSPSPPPPQKRTRTISRVDVVRKGLPGNADLFKTLENELPDLIDLTGCEK